MDSSNGIWLCQTCAKLVDNDELRFPRDLLEAWKRSAEGAAARALSAAAEYSGDNQYGFSKAEKLMPVLLEEMRADLKEHPTRREFVLLSKKWSYNSGGKLVLVYYLEDHNDLEGKLDVLANLGLVTEITYNDVRRYVFEEDFVDYLVP